MKKLLSLFLVLSLLIMSLAACNVGGDDENNENERTEESTSMSTTESTSSDDASELPDEPTYTTGFWYQPYKTGFQTTNYGGTHTEINLCDTYEDLPVLAIHQSTFQNKTSITSITLPGTLVELIGRPFKGCTALTYNVHDHAKYLGTAENPYFALISATSTEITDCTIHPDTKIIAPYAFENCTALTEIAIPGGVKTIGTRAFSGCTALTGVSVPDSVTIFPKDIFANCTALTYTVFDSAKYLGNALNPYTVLMQATDTEITSCTIHSDTKIIAPSAFQGCTQMSAITIPNGITLIGSSAFAGCTGLAAVSIPVGVLEIESEAFIECTGITTLTIQNGVTMIGTMAFAYCPNLSSVSLPESLVVLNTGVFFHCTALTEITFPAAVNTIGSGLFDGCDSLTSVTFSNTSDWQSTDSVSTTSGQTVDVSDATANATNLRGDLCYLWLYRRK